MKIIFTKKCQPIRVSDIDYDDLCTVRWHMIGKYAHSNTVGGLAKYVLGRMGITYEHPRRAVHYDGDPRNNQRANLRVGDYKKLEQLSRQVGQVRYMGKSALDADKPWCVYIGTTFIEAFATKLEAELHHDAYVVENYGEWIFQYHPRGNDDGTYNDIVDLRAMQSLLRPYVKCKLWERFSVPDAATSFYEQVEWIVNYSKQATLLEIEAFCKII